MDIKLVQKLAEVMENAQLSSLEICEGDTKISMARGFAPVAAPAAMPAAAIAPAVATEAAAAPAALPGEMLVAPLVGIGYHAASPEAKPYVTVGQAVKKGDTLCLIEAMKLMNEFNAPKDGVIAEICFENGALVEFGQPLFRLT